MTLNPSSPLPDGLGRLWAYWPARVRVLFCVLRFPRSLGVAHFRGKGQVVVL